MDLEQTTGSAPGDAACKLERRGHDLEAQLHHARREQDRIRRKLQTRLLAVTLESAQRQRDLEARLDDALAELSATRAERDRIRQDLEARLASALVERTRVEKDHEDRLAKADRRSSRLEDELREVYASLSWRLTAPLRWLNAPFARRKRR
jgi:DNA repair exonuclease SbcCD ATPase subunit